MQKNWQIDEKSNIRINDLKCTHYFSSNSFEETQLLYSIIQSDASLLMRGLYISTVLHMIVETWLFGGDTVHLLVTYTPGTQ